MPNLEIFGYYYQYLIEHAIVNNVTMEFSLHFTLFVFIIDFHCSESNKNVQLSNLIGQ